ncbi:signal transduction histidine kinase [Aequitasia blattaphilus]|uniref:histidine kinase n=1 Tax=Aequitasia blattaphilus TaxID=2949332 RepID=A0ABT1E7D9_9FIRM|nr:HAMP domain-containing sensor histidine kinase [Aequitasia blattaphilus]MCP1100892.1 HAMP domain-containing histidine kinase [Aequitasia blattaphilus]MCR8613532.1 HAMP domain-containing histidine kinase [Aequitasia blattaphilus]
MRSTLHLKFYIIYIIYGFLSFFVVASLSTNALDNLLFEEITSTMYKEASMIASDYLVDYYTDKIDERQVSTVLKGVEKQLDASVWFVARDGEMIASAYSDRYQFPPSKVENFNPAEMGGHRYLVGSYHDYFNQEVLTVLSPVIHGLSPGGYLLIHKSTQSIYDFHSRLMFYVYGFVLITYVFSFLVLVGYNFLVYRPLRKITEAAKQYASGNLDYVIPVNKEDEIGYLSASLNYMSAQLRDMENYQRSFVANVSHDFRSPLTSIKGYVEAIVDGTIPPEMQEKYLKIILNETERLTDLTKDLLTLNAYDKGQMPLERETFDIHEVIKNVVSSLEGICKEKQLSIDLILATKHLSVYADKSKIQQVLYNLIDNALKFSEPNTIVTIETTDISEKISVSVKDDGCGISSNELSKIWDRFYKADLSRGKDRKGTGLGLSIVKDILGAHGENIHVVSTEGVGTEFKFTLPKKKSGRSI